jgi:23S rRNA pseudouridine2457 synthase
MQIIRFWKPYGVLTKFTDTEGRPTLADYINVPNVYAAGRLDMDSEGLLLLTDSARLSTRLTDPKFEHPRTYWVQVERMPDESALQKLRDGVDLKDGRTRPAKVRLLDTPPNIPDRPVPIRFRKNVPDCWLELTITEGRNRQVRRMTAAVGHPTLRLVRWAIGKITLAGLQPGIWGKLSEIEAQALRQSAFQRN